MLSILKRTVIARLEFERRMNALSALTGRPTDIACSLQAEIRLARLLMVSK